MCPQKTSAQQQTRQADTPQNKRTNNHAHYNDRKPRRKQRPRQDVVPQTSTDILAKLKVAQLRERADELNIDVTGLKKAQLVAAVYEASIEAEGFKSVAGLLDIMPDGYGFLR